MAQILAQFDLPDCHAPPVPRQNDDQLLNQHLASRPVTLLKVKFSCSQSFGEGQYYSQEYLAKVSFLARSATSSVTDP
jgi:hypothetical protein